MTVSAVSTVTTENPSTTTESTSATTAALVQKLHDVYEIEKVMAKHVYYHALARHHEELDDIWVQHTPDPHFAQNQGYFIGMESLRSYYGDLNITMQKANLEAVHKRDSSVELDEKNYGVGIFQVHPLTTQIVEVAEDRQTAKGIWYSPGAVGGPNAAGESTLLWMWEKYGVDFVLENGQWKIWHLHTYTDFGIPVGSEWSDSSTNSMMGPGAGAEQDQPAATIELPKPDREEELYQTLSYKTVPQAEPRIPQPYRTFSETFSY